MFGTLPRRVLDSPSSLLVPAVLCCQIFWFLAAGLSPATSLISAFAYITVGAVGLQLLKLLAPGTIDSHVSGLYLAGPGFGLGCFALFWVRLFSTKTILLVLVLTAFIFTASWLTRTVVLSVLRDQEHLGKSGIGFCACFVLFTALTGFQLESRWGWPLYLLLLAVITLFAIERLFIGANWAMMAPLSLLLLISAIAATRLKLPPLWWATTEGIPIDEPILEATSNGLVEFGPVSNPLFESIDAASSVSYHHLALLFAGIVNELSEAKTYQALLIVLPVVIAVSSASSLLLLVSRGVQNSPSTFHPGVLSLFGIVYVMSVGQIGHSITSWFGLSSLLGCISIIRTVDLSEVKLRSLLLVATTILVVTFSKVPFSYFSVVIITVLAIRNRKAMIWYGVVSIMTLLLVATWFRINAFADNSLIMDWNVWSKLDTIYELKVAALVYLLPVALAVASFLLIVTSDRSAEAEFSWGLICVVLIGQVSQLVISSTFASPESYFGVPGSVAATLLVSQLANLADSHEPISTVRWLYAGPVSAGLVVLSLLAQKKTELLSLPVVALLLVSVFVVFRGVCVRNSRGKRTLRVRSWWKSIAVIVLLIATVDGVGQANSRRTIQLKEIMIDYDQTDWYGDSQLVEVITAIKSLTKTDSLLAVGLCSENSYQPCLPDHRIAALAGRRLLASETPILEEDLPNKVLEDIVLSKAIGTRDPKIALSELTDRGVNYVVLNRSVVGPRWTEYNQSSEFPKLFSNQDYVLISLQK